MLTLKEINPGDPDYHKPLDELIEDLRHADPASRYGDVQIMTEDLTDAIHYLKAYKEDRDDLTALRAYWEEMHKDVIKKAEVTNEDGKRID